MKRAAVIVNPISGRGQGHKAGTIAAEALRARGVEVLLHETSAAGEARVLAEELGPDVDCVVAVGGDGTLNEVIGGAAAGTVLGLVPAGTANVVARDLRIPRSPRRAAELLLEGRPRALDVGMVNEHRFLAMVGIGFDGAVVRGVEERREGPITMASYTGPSIAAFRGVRPEELRISVDGTALSGPFYGAIISNTRNYGGLFSVTPDADLADGCLDLQARRDWRRRSILLWGLAGVLGWRLPAGSATYQRGRRFVVDADSPVPVQADGDFLGTTPVDISLLEEQVSIIAPGVSS